MKLLWQIYLMLKCKNAQPNILWQSFLNSWYIVFRWMTKNFINEKEPMTLIIVIVTVLRRHTMTKWKTNRDAKTKADLTSRMLDAHQIFMIQQYSLDTPCKRYAMQSERDTNCASGTFILNCFCSSTYYTKSRTVLLL